MLNYKSLYEKKIKNSRYHCCWNVWNLVKIKCICKQITWYFDFKFSYKCVDFGKIFKNEIYLFSFGQSMKKTIAVNVGYFCMGSKMMWDNFVNLSLILC